MLTADQLLTGYASGVFPMAQSASNPQLYWFDPLWRGILPVGGIHASRSLRRSLRRDGWQASSRPCFDTIVAACAGRPETWINAPLRRLYAELYRRGHAHALAVLQEGQLAGGIFGVTLGAAFFGESMFSIRTNGSKMALVWLSDHLNRCGFTLFDTQYLTPHLASMGGIEISRAAYHRRLAAALSRRADFHAYPLPSAESLLASLSASPASISAPSDGPMPSPPSGASESGS
ncbi:MAG TPA: leucyl/phenylalanyl-tRNA--protein transferase [Paracoccus sp. (in: a-proteobacteria)]|nr:leucyl/phenylalanyl-tRNA--protein transferase [Paracoccus sp. (in: a-proteobacteria)]